MATKNNFQYNILLVDDYPPVRRVLKRIIEESPELRVVGELNDGRDVLQFLQKSPVNMVVLDISMPNLGGFEAAMIVKKQRPDVKVLILTIHNYKEYLNQAMDLGAEGYMLKEEVSDELLDAITSLREGKTYISSRVA
jgi:DNA-binding NarL/FixJ family response regulator